MNKELDVVTRNTLIAENYKLEGHLTSMKEILENAVAISGDYPYLNTHYLDSLISNQYLCDRVGTVDNILLEIADSNGNDFENITKESNMSKELVNPKTLQEVLKQEAQKFYIDHLFTLSAMEGGYENADWISFDTKEWEGEEYDWENNIQIGGYCMKIVQDMYDQNIVYKNYIDNLVKE